ncbi:MAG: hypothetical protein EOO01_03550 [Chitinophagaceae bacterium]|nr:MAG: hypothetical protein EOO01_03550 [Chitinophagaceae bacterium]
MHFARKLVFNRFSWLTIFLLVTITVDAQESQPLLQIETGTHNAETNDVSADAYGRLFVTCAENNVARLWDASTGDLIRAYRIPADLQSITHITAAAISEDGKLIALGSSKQTGRSISYTLYVCSAKTGDFLFEVPQIPNRINVLRFSPDAETLALSFGKFDEACGVRIYNAKNGAYKTDLGQFTNPVFSFAFNRDNFILADNKSKVRLYDKEFRLSKELETAPLVPFEVTLNHDGSQMSLSFNSSTNFVEIHDPSTLKLLYTSGLQGSRVKFSADGKQLYSPQLEYVQNINDWVTKLNIVDNKPKAIVRQIDLVDDAFSGLEVLPNGNLLFLGKWRSLGVCNSNGSVIWKKVNPAINIEDDLTQLRINVSGSIVGVKPSGQPPLTFDVPNRKISFEQSEFPSYVDKNSTLVECWNSRACGTGVIINGIAASFVENSTAVDLSANGQDVVLGSYDYLYRSNAKAQLIWRTLIPGGVYRGVNISGNNKVVSALLPDGTLRWYRMSDGKELLALFLHADKKTWILFTPGGYYDASPGAESLLGWEVFNEANRKTDFYPIVRFKNKFYRPDIIDEILVSYDEESAEYAANQKRGGKPINSEKLSEDNLPPTVTITSPADKSEISDNSVTISYKFKTPARAPIKNIRVLVDGRPVAVERGIKSGQSEIESITVNVPPKDCVITLLAENENGISPESNLYLKRAPASKANEHFIYKPKLYVLAIGISNYNSPSLKLNLASKDADDFVNSISLQKGNLYSDVVVRRLLDRDATKDAITDGLEWIQKQTGQKDVAMIFYAGHGMNDNNGIFYMLPVGADMDRVRTTCVNFEELRQTVSSIAGKVVVFIDACHSGNAMGTRRGETDINSIVNELSNAVNGAITYTSSTGKEFSLEDAAWGNGAFTKALLEGLAGKASFGKEKISIKSLDVYLSDRVKELTNGRQHPTSVSPPNVPDFPIAVVLH